MNEKAFKVLQEIDKAGIEGITCLGFDTGVLIKLRRKNYIAIAEGGRCAITQLGIDQIENELNGTAKK